ncbi:MarR family winged helix-turn-helix transcriptional regulator [Bacteroides sp. AN502(2024)]|uniref:MarR family winged helix-turn-helix transcriptional regulator n=1 Tax=Bacteroides sp. AN502(2024) TaxID=3160599 RepID=UPI003513C82E
MKTIYAMCDVFKAMRNFEKTFEKTYQITLNEAMILCALKEASEKVTATHLSKQTELSPSHTSKMLRILEEKGLIVRSLGSKDRRQMYFQLTPTGNQRVTELTFDKIKIPKLLRPLFK